MIAIPPTLARRVFDAAPDAMVIIDTFGTIWYANRQVSVLFGRAHEEIVGESIETLLPERFRSQLIGPRGHIVSNGRVRPVDLELDLHGERRDGTEFPLELSSSPVEDVGQTLIVATLRDATLRKRLEAELAVALDAIEAMRELADRANQGMKHFLEAAGHDRKTHPESLTSGQ